MKSALGLYALMRYHEGEVMVSWPCGRAVHPCEDLSKPFWSHAAGLEYKAMRPLRPRADPPRRPWWQARLHPRGPAPRERLWNLRATLTGGRVEEGGATGWGTLGGVCQERSDQLAFQKLVPWAPNGRLEAPSSGRLSGSAPVWHGIQRSRSRSLVGSYRWFGSFWEHVLQQKRLPKGRFGSDPRLLAGAE